MKVAVSNKDYVIMDIVPENTKEDSTFLVNNDYSLLDVSSPIDIGKASYRELTDEELAPLRIKSLNETYKTEINNITEGIEAQEVATWTKQEAEARAYLLNNSSYTPLIDAIVSARGVTKEYLVNKIIEKADLYSVTIGEIMGRKQKLEDGI